jgi:Ca2+-binding RTX toxin-like protein
VSPLRWLGGSALEEGRAFIMRALRGVAVVTVSVAALLLARAAPSQAASEPRPTCFGKAATIVGTPGPDWLDGGPDDVVVGLGGDDILFGGTVCGGVGNDSLTTGAYSLSNQLDGGDGDDIIRGEAGATDLLLGGAGNDYLADTNDTDYEDAYDPGTDVMKGGPGDDRLISTAGRNLVYGNAGNDYIVDFTHVRTVISGGAGNDTIDATGDNTGVNPYQPDQVAGDAGRDWATVNRMDKVSSTERVTYRPPTFCGFGC